MYGPLLETGYCIGFTLAEDQEERENAVKMEEKQLEQSIAFLKRRNKINT